MTTVDDCDGNLATGEPHGTAVASIVHEMAPGAQLSLICVADEVDLAQRRGVREGERHQDRQPLRRLVQLEPRRRHAAGRARPTRSSQDARAHGILWVNAAGNYARSTGAGRSTADGDGRFQDFAPGDARTTVWIPTGGTTCAFLKWDDWPTTAQDYDLYL